MKDNKQIITVNDYFSHAKSKHANICMLFKTILRNNRNKRNHFRKCNSYSASYLFGGRVTNSFLSFPTLDLKYIYLDSMDSTGA